MYPKKVPLPGECCWLLQRSALQGTVLWNSVLTIATAVKWMAGKTSQLMVLYEGTEYQGTGCYSSWQKATSSAREKDRPSTAIISLTSDGFLGPNLDLHCWRSWKSDLLEGGLTWCPTHGTSNAGSLSWTFLLLPLHFSLQRERGPLLPAACHSFIQQQHIRVHSLLVCSYQFWYLILSL